MISKAELLAIGEIHAEGIPSKMLSISSGGPGAGAPSLFARVGKQRIRLILSKDSQLKIKNENGKNRIFLGDRTLECRLEKPLSHCPEQAYIMVSTSCNYGCKFCELKAKRDNRDVIKIVRNAAVDPMLKAISLTSGIPLTPSLELEKMVNIVKELREEFNCPIGVSIYPAEGASEKLFQAGVDEIKYNIESFDHKILRKVCPNKSLEYILHHLKEAVNTFGEGKVFSNVIIGLGESDSTVIRGLEELTSIGVIAHLRPLTMPRNSAPLIEATMGKAERPNAARILFLSRSQKEILNNYGLIYTGKTMCGLCSACQLSPTEV
jgi:biotin synthase-related radical SAM superfamily protein